MYTVRPIAHHFVFWLLLAPLFLLEARALEQLAQTLALQDGTHTRTVLADITAHHMGSRGPEIRYQFQVQGSTERYTEMNTAGWGVTWVPVSAEAWAAAEQSGKIPVKYLPEDPRANQPVERLGHPIGDSLFSWIVFLFVDLIWLFETCVMLSNYVRCLVAAERRQPARLRFWKSRQLPSVLERHYRQRAFKS